MNPELEEKICTKCGLSKPLSEFHKNKGKCVSACKDCTHKYKVEYYAKNKDDIAIKNKQYREKNIEMCKAKARKHYAENREKILKDMREYQEREKERIKEKKHEYYLKNKEYFNQKRKEHYLKNKEIEQAVNLRYAEKNRAKISKHQSEYSKTPAGKLAEVRHSHKRRVFGFDPINNRFERSEFHHLNLAGNKDIGIFIPTVLHRSIRHDSNTGRNLNEINSRAISWLISNTVTQATIFKQIIECEASL